MIQLGVREVELLALLVEAEETEPSRMFVAAYMSGASNLRHMRSKQANLGEPDVPALMALDAAGLLTVERYHNSRPGAFYLRSGAREVLDAARAQQGQPTPLSQAEGRVATLERRIERGVETRQAAARRFGRAVRWVVIPAALALIAAVTWLTAGLTAGAGVLLAVAAAYALITTGLGLDALKVAGKAEEAAARWAERQLRAWTDPDE